MKKLLFFPISCNMRFIYGMMGYYFIYNIVLKSVKDLLNKLLKLIMPVNCLALKCNNKIELGNPLTILKPLKNYIIHVTLSLSSCQIYIVD